MQERGAVAALRERRRHRPVAATAAVAAIVVAADQATTSWALATLHRPEHLVGPLGLALEYNPGTAFSLFSGGGDWIVAVVSALLAAMCWLAWRARRVWVGVAYGLVLGGALGNLSDRLFRGHHGDVIDFVTLSHWPTFNIADSAITVGVVVLIVVILVRPESDFHRSPPSGAEATVVGVSGAEATVFGVSGAEATVSGDSGSGTSHCAPVRVPAQALARPPASRASVTGQGQ